MNSVKVMRRELIQRIQKNRDEHRELFLRAREGYRQRVIEELDEMLQEARDNKFIRTTVKLRAPEDHTKEYDRVLEMLDMSTEDSIDIDSHSFSCYVRNEWDWFDRAMVSNSTYASGGKLGL